MSPSTLQLEFRRVKFCVYGDDIAFVTHTKADLLAVLNKVHELLQGLGFRINHPKTEIAHWSPHYKKHTIQW